MSKKKLAVLQPKYRIEDLQVKPQFEPLEHLKRHRKRLFSEDSLKVERCLGYQYLRGSNLCAIAPNTIIYAAGAFLIVFDCIHRTQHMLPTISGRGATRIVAHPSKDSFAVAEKTTHFAVYIFSFPGYELLRILEDQKIKSPCDLIDFNPSGDMLLTLSEFPENKVSLWVWEKEFCTAIEVASQFRIHDISFSHVNPNIFTTSGEHHVRFWKIREKTLSKTHYFESVQKAVGDKEHPNAYKALHLPNGMFLAALDSGFLAWWLNPFEEGAFREMMGRKGSEPCHKGSIHDILMVGDFVMTIGSDGWVHLWNYKVIIRRIKIMADEPKCIEVEPLDEILIDNDVSLYKAVPALVENADKLWYVQDETSGLWRFDISTNRSSNPPKQIIRGFGTEITGLDACEIYPMVVVGSLNGLVSVVDCTTHKELCFRRFNAGVTCVKWADTNFDKSGSSVLVGHEDGTIRWLRVLTLVGAETTISLHAAIKPHNKSVLCLNLNQDCTTMATYSADKTLFFFAVEDFQLTPLGYYEIEHDVKWLYWIQIAQSTQENERLSAQQQEDEEKYEDMEIFEAFDTEKHVDATRVDEKVEKREYVDETEAIPLSPEQDNSSECSNTLSVESEELSDTPDSSSGASSPYEEEKLVHRYKRDKKQTHMLEDSKTKDIRNIDGVKHDDVQIRPTSTLSSSTDQSEISDRSSLEEIIPETKLREKLLLCCNGCYLLDIDAPDPTRYYGLQNRETLLIPLENVQTYIMKPMRSYHDLGDRIYDSEDEEHPNRSELVKQYFREMKFAEKRASRRRRWRELGMTRNHEPPEILCYLPSDRLGHLWLSLSGMDSGYLFEYLFERSETFEPIDLVPLRAVELLTSQFTPALSLSMSPCGEFIFLGQDDGCLSIGRFDKLFDISTGYDFAKYHLHNAQPGEIMFTAVTAGGKHVVTAGKDGNVFILRFWVPHHTEHDVKEMTRPITKDELQDEQDIDDSDFPTLEEHLIKSIRLLMTDKITQTLNEINTSLLELKTEYKCLKGEYLEFQEECVVVNSLKEIYATFSSFSLNAAGAHPICLTIFEEETKLIVDQVAEQYKAPTAEWASYYDALHNAFIEPLENKKIYLKEPKSGEVVENYIECALPAPLRREIYKYDPDVYEYTEYRPRKHGYTKNFALLKKLRMMLHNLNNSIVSCPKTMTPSKSINEYNKRKLNNIKRIKQLIHFEEMNPQPEFDDEDEYYYDEKTKVEQMNFKLKSNKTMRTFLPKEMKYDLYQKKESILVHLNKAKLLRDALNSKVQILDQMMKETSDYDKESRESAVLKRNQCEIEGSIGVMHDVVNYVEILIVVLVEDSQFQPNAVVAPVPTASSSTTIDDKQKNTISEDTTVVQEWLASDTFLSSEFHYDYCYCKHTSRPATCEPLYFENSTIPDLKEQIKNLKKKAKSDQGSVVSEMKSTISSTGSLFNANIKYPKEIITHSSSAYRGHKGEYNLKSYTVNNKVAYVAAVKLKPTRGKKLTSSFHFNHDTLPLIYENITQGPSHVATPEDSSSVRHHRSIRYDNLLEAYVKGGEKLIETMAQHSTTPMSVGKGDDDTWAMVERVWCMVNETKGETVKNAMKLNFEEDVETEERELSGIEAIEKKKFFDSFAIKNKVKESPKASIGERRESVSNNEQCQIALHGFLPQISSDIHLQYMPFFQPQRGSINEEITIPETVEISNDCFIGVNRLTESGEAMQKRNDELCERRRHHLRWQFFQNLHHITVAHKSLIDCQKKFHDISYNTKCRELHIIEDKFSTIASVKRQIVNQEKNVVFECTKLEILKYVYRHAQVTVSKLKKEWDSVFMEFMKRIGPEDRNVKFFKQFFGRRNSSLVPAPDLDEEAEIETGSIESEEHIEEQKLVTRKEEMTEKPGDIDQELYQEAGRRKELRYELERQMDFFHKRMARCSNKKHLISKKVKKCRNIIAEIVPKIAKLQISMKEQLDVQPMVALISTQRIECGFLPIKPKKNIRNLCKSLKAKSESVNNLVEAAIKSVEETVIISTLIEGRNLAHALMMRDIARHKYRAGHKKKQQKDGEQEQKHVNFGNDEQMSSGVVAGNDESYKKTYSLKQENCDISEINEELLDNEEPEHETPLKGGKAISRCIPEYKDYSQIIEGDIFAYPDYFMHPVDLKNKSDIEYYQFIYSCIKATIREVVSNLEKDKTIVIKDVVTNMVNIVTMCMESVMSVSQTSLALDTQADKETETDGELVLNPGGGLALSLEVLKQMENNDAQKYQYSTFFGEEKEEEKESEQRSDSSESSDEGEMLSREFTGLNEKYIVISKCNLDRLHASRKWLEDGIRNALRKRKKEVSYYRKLDKMNDWIKKFVLKDIKFQIMDTMMAKFGREVDLETLLDTIDNPLAQVAKFNEEKKLRLMRRNSQFHHKISVTQREQLDRMVYINHLLWIRYSNLREEFDFHTSIYKNKRKVLPHISSLQGP